MPKNPESLHLSAPAKLNLFLHVLGRSGELSSEEPSLSPIALAKGDGYHLIESLAVFTRFGDHLEVRESQTISLQVEGPFADECGPLESNLVLRAAHALAALAPAPVGASLKLHKYIPAASGLGGGSSDAAATIKLLIQLWDLRIENQVLAGLALGLGADVPVCLRRRPTTMRGIGDQLSIAHILPLCYVLLVNPRIALSTQAVFEKLNGPFSEALPALSRHISSAKKLVRYLKARGNDLQQPAIELLPEIQTVLNSLEEQKGCLLARMSGSGATCFGLFANADEMGAAARIIKRDHPKYWLAQTRFA